MSTVYKITTGELGFSITDPGVAIATADIDDYTDFSAVVTSAKLVASPNSTDEEVPGTFTSPASTTTTPTGTTFTLEAEVLQDPQDDTGGLAKFLYDNDSGESGNPVYFYLALADGAAPKAIGACYIAPQDFGGEARSVLTASVSFVVEGRPEIEFGTAADA